jgi:hypothetical protein
MILKDGINHYLTLFFGRFWHRHITKVIYWATILYFNFARLFFTVNFYIYQLKTKHQ